MGARIPVGLHRSDAEVVSTERHSHATIPGSALRTGGGPEPCAVSKGVFTSLVAPVTGAEMDSPV